MSKENSSELETTGNGSSLSPSGARRWMNSVTCKECWEEYDSQLTECPCCGDDETE